MARDHDGDTIHFGGGPAPASSPGGIDPYLGTVIEGRYLVDSVLGEGGMGIVYAGRHRTLAKRVAIKVLKRELADDRDMLERFFNEARAASSIGSPHIADVADFGMLPDGTAYFVMEYLDGVSLGGLLDQLRMIPTPRLLKIARQMAVGLSAAHAAGIVHRDLKPDNVMLVSRGIENDFVKILDFGIAKSMHDSRLTGQGELFGTPQYMAPERIKNAEAGPAADLYALGVVFYELLTGELPFDAADIATFFVKHLRDVPPPPSSRNPEVPPELDALVATMLAKEPEGRPVDAHRVQTTALEILTALSLDAPPTPETLSESSAQRFTLEPASDHDVWRRRVALFDDMLTVAYGDHKRAPRELLECLLTLHELVARHAQAHFERAEARRVAERTDAAHREQRLQLGFAVDVLGQDASRAKEEARAAHALALQGRARDEDLAGRLRALAKEQLFWEGRAAFREPTVELAEAYERLAATTREWLEVRAEQAERAAQLATKEARVLDIDFQIRELRAALANLEQRGDEERAREEREAEEREEMCAMLETQLISETQLFCMPLRKRRELGPHFKQLEAVGAHP